MPYRSVVTDRELDQVWREINRLRDWRYNVTPRLYELERTDRAAARRHRRVLTGGQRFFGLLVGLVTAGAELYRAFGP